jgi:hypothetical protein
MTPTLRMKGSATALALTLGLAGCAVTPNNGEWSDPGFANRSLIGTKVFAVCRAQEPSVARACEEGLLRSLRDAGAVPVMDSRSTDTAVTSDVVLQMAREAGAQVAISSHISIATVNTLGPTMGFGMGFGRGGIGFGMNGFGVGAGMAIPMGGVRPANIYGANTVMIDVASGREMWTLRATHPFQDEATVQAAALAGGSVDAMKRSGMFGPR